MHQILDDCVWTRGSRSYTVFIQQDFAKNKAIPQGEDHVVYFPPVWNWSQQFSVKDLTLFNNPMYVGKGAACVQNGEVKTFKRTKVTADSVLVYALFFIYTTKTVETRFSWNAFWWRSLDVFMISLLETHRKLGWRLQYHEDFHAGGEMKTCCSRSWN